MNTPCMTSRRIGFAFLATAGLSACLSGCQRNSQVTQVSVSPTDSVQVDTIEVNAVELARDVAVPQDVVYAEATEALEQSAATSAEKPSSELALAPDTAAALPQGTLNITFDKIKFEMEKNADFKRSLITPDIEKLSGRNIRIRGYILPKLVFSQTGIKFFVLVRDNQVCCFGPGAMLYDCVMVYMNPGKSTDFTTGVITVEGKFSIEVNQGPDGKTQAIYRLDADSAK